MEISCFLAAFFGFPQQLAANLVLEDAIERIYVGKYYGDINLGLFVIRGENVVLLGEINEEKESKTNLIKVSIDDILVMYEEEKAEQKKANDKKTSKQRKEDLMRTLRESGALYEE